MKKYIIVILILFIGILAGISFYFWQSGKREVNNTNFIKQENEIHNSLKKDEVINDEAINFKGMDSLCKVDSECDEENNSPKINLKSCVDDFVCEEGYSCYHSQYSGMGPNGLAVGEEEGDLKCHKICINDNDCVEGGECKSIKIIGGDVIINQKMCF